MTSHRTLRSRENDYWYRCGACEYEGPYSDWKTYKAWIIICPHCEMTTDKSLKNRREERPHVIIQPYGTLVVDEGILQ